VALRFQGKSDEIERAAKEERNTPALIIIFVLFAAIHGVLAWVQGESFASYAKDLAWLLAFCLTYWILAPFYYEFHIRTEEIDGKVSAIEKAVNASEEAHAELLEKLTAIEDKLGELSEKVENMNPGEGVAYSTSGIREGLRTIEERLDRTDAP